MAEPKIYVMTATIRKRLLGERDLSFIPTLNRNNDSAHVHKNHRRAGPYSRNYNSYRYRQATWFGEINCRKCGADLVSGVEVASRTGHKGRAILRCKPCDDKVYGNGKRRDEFGEKKGA